MFKTLQKFWHKHKNSFKFQHVTVAVILATLVFTTLNTIVLDRLISYSSSTDTVVVNKEVPENNMKSMYTIAVTIENIPPWVKTDEWGFVNSGSAVAISDHELLTANHVIDPTGYPSTPSFILYKFDLQGNLMDRIPFRVVKADPSVDLALLETDETLTNHVSFESEEVFEAMPLNSVVYGLGAGVSVTKTYIQNPYCYLSGVLRDKHSEADVYGPDGMIKHYEDITYYSSPVLPGCSGGGTFNYNTNNFIGITSLGSEYQTGFIPINVVNKFLNK